MNVTKHANFLSLNVCGLRKKLNDGILEQYIKDFHIVCLSETKVDDMNESLLPDGFKYLFKDKPSQSNFPFGGVHGLGVLLRKEIFNFVSIIKHD